MKVTPKGLKAADVLSLTDTGTPADEGFESTNITASWKVLKLAMAAGFKGRIIVAMTHDELATYAAERLLGLNKREVVG